MSSQKMLFLRWDGFLNNAVSELKESQNENEFFDVTVVAGDGGKVQANKLVLAAASTFFFKILKENPDPDPLIYLGGVSSQMLQYLMDFIYTGAVRIPPDDSNDFLDIAVELRFKGMIGVLASEKTGGDKSESCTTTSKPRKKHVTFSESSPASKPPIPPVVTSLTPATHQIHVASGELSPSHSQSKASVSKTFGLSSKYSHRRVLTSRTPDLSPPQSATTGTPALHLGLASVTPVLRQRRHTGDSPGLSARPHSVHKVTHSPQRQKTVEGTPVIKSSRSQIETPSHYHSTFPEATSEENEGSTIFKVEVGAANDYNVHYETNEHGGQFISRFYERSLHKNDGTEISKDQKLKDRAMSTYAMPKAEIDSNSETIGMDTLDGNDDEQTHEDYNSDLIKECYVKIEKIKCSKKQCLVCFKTFRFVCNLNKHKRIHTGERPYQCPVCAKKFSQSEHLKVHKKIHTGDRPFQCSVCPRTFSQEAHLETHKKLHNGGRPYECSECNKEFSHFAYWKAHNKIHTGERPHKCLLCSKAFFSLYEVKRHMNRKKRCSKKH